MSDESEEAALAAWAASFGKDGTSAPTSFTPDATAGGADDALPETRAAALGDPAPTSRIRPFILVLALALGGVSLWYLVGGGRAVVERLLARTAPSSARLSAKASVDQVRDFHSGPQNLSVVERLDVVADRLELHGITLTERRWDCTSDGQDSTVTCVLKGPGYENPFQWKVDRVTGEVSPANGPAGELEAFDVEALHGKVAAWDPQQGATAAGPQKAPAGPEKGGAGPQMAPSSGPAAHPSAAGTAPAAPVSGSPVLSAARPEELSLIGVVATPTGGKALFRTPRGIIEVSLGSRIGDWTLAEINHRSNGESAVILRHRDGMRELRMAQQRGAPGVSAGGGRPRPSAAPSSQAAHGPDPVHASPGGGDADNHPPPSPSGEPHGPARPPSGEPHPPDGPSGEPHGPP